MLLESFEDRSESSLTYFEERTLKNYGRYRIVLLLTIILAVVFLVRNIYYGKSEGGIDFNYFSVYLHMLIVSCISLLSVFILYSHKKFRQLSHFFFGISLCLFLLFCHLALLDSFDFNSYDFTSYIFGSLMFAFIYRTEKFKAVILYLSGMVYYTVVYFFLRPDIFRVPALLPMFGATVFAVYFSFYSENLNRRLFDSSRKLEESNKRLVELSVQDPLTGLYNRRHMDYFLAHQLAVFNRNKTPFSIIFTDLDHFKRINDELGHSTGDGVLKEFADLLREGARETDLVVRYGGEEFLLVLTDTECEQAILIAERIRTQTEHHDFCGVPRRISASFGLAEVKPGDSIETLIERVDSLLYKAKRRGRNLCVCDKREGAFVTD